MNELEEEIEILKNLAMKFKNDLISLHYINLDIKRFEDLLRIKINQYNILVEINKFQEEV